jgi:hypothetical protein
MSILTDIYKQPTYEKWLNEKPGGK